MLRTIFNNLKGRFYGSLSFDHKCVVYAYKLFEDGMDFKIAEEKMFDFELTEEFVSSQLERVYGYKKDTII